MPKAELRSWLHDPDPKKFPYQEVVRHFHGVGKHFVRKELLQLLAEVRDLLPTMRGPWPHVQTLAAFLNTALDKPDGRYDYPTYLALPLLQLPAVDDPVEQAPFARSRCDRLVTHLVCDALSFELAALDGRTTLLPKMRPAPDLVAKRCKHGLRVIRPALGRMSLDGGLTSSDAGELVRQACSVVHADMSFAEQRAIGLGVLPVDTVHDEYMFLRVLQAFETTFALLAVQLNGATAALAERRVDKAVHFLNGSETALRESAPLFSMLATMQVESFRTFREFTEGASAIQSRNYKIVESLCRTPDKERVDSAAYRSVPDVRERVLGRQPTLDDAYVEVCASGDLDAAERERLRASMETFAGALLRWRNTHYRLAVRMLGEASGTGYTEGTPYLNSVRDVPVFRTVDVTGETSGTRTGVTR
ncbi:tryptophan 2,3-dioxygenase [Streptomyces antnestii]|uniref:Tryptophan 2,3-dioxygenase n=1 Tax=Streptomyces antnestii TaxID=2494256 RepID=A0A437PNI5_9ACTN|nr:tryptophan 2,3-dioxygenase family protein [Streptomyces sp. San01]RVU23852.1 tryptophan 2,3-dioxygenase [Streptomyces sp. San01]